MGANVREASEREAIRLIFEDLAQRAMDLDGAVVLDEAHPAELIHEEVDALPRSADHFSQTILADCLQNCRPLFRVLIVGQEKKNPGKPLFAGVEHVIDEVLLHTLVPREQVVQELRR